MRRKMKLIYLILAYVEKATHIGNIPLPELAEYTEEEVAYHVKLCSEAGYLDIVVDAHNKKPVGIDRLTWQGHEALEKLHHNNEID